jgi:hypothetical protein
MAYTLLVGRAAALETLLTMSMESPVTLYKINYRGAAEFQLKWSEAGEAREARFATEAEAVMETTMIEERLRVAALAGQGLTVNPFGLHLPFITSKDVHYASLKLQPKGLKFRDVIDDYVAAVNVLKGTGATVAAAVTAYAEDCKMLKPYDTTPQQAVFEWLELKKQAGDRPLYEILKVYLKAKDEPPGERPAAG